MHSHTRTHVVTTRCSSTICHSASICLLRAWIVTLGSAQVWVEHDGRRLRLPVTVAKSQDAALFAFDWCRAWNMPLPKGVKLCAITPKPALNAQRCTDVILKEFAEVFDTSKPGLMKDHPVKIHINENGTTEAFPARVVSFPLRKGVEQRASWSRELSPDVRVIAYVIQRA